MPPPEYRGATVDYCGCGRTAVPSDLVRRTRCQTCWMLPGPVPESAEVRHHAATRPAGD